MVLPLQLALDMRAPTANLNRAGNRNPSSQSGSRHCRLKAGTLFPVSLQLCRNIWLELLNL